MQQTDLVAKLAENSGLSKDQASKAVKALEATIVDGLKADGEVKLTGFLTFTRQDKPAKTGRNPATGQSMEIAAKTVVAVKPGARLKNALAG